MPKAKSNADCLFSLADEIAAIWVARAVGPSERIRLDDYFDSLAGLFTQTNPDSDLCFFEPADLSRLQERLQNCAELFVREQSAALLWQGLEHFSRDGLRAFFFSALYESLRFHPDIRPEEESKHKRSRYKRRGSAYFTPPALAYLAVSRAFAHYDQKQCLPRICDPAMGTGLYLVAALDYLSSSQRQLDRAYIAGQSLFGIDLDPITCGVAKNCLTIAAGAFVPQFCQNLLWADALTSRLPSFDLVLGNPPWDMVKATASGIKSKVPSRVNRSKIAQLRRGFQYQGEGDTSYYKLFLERSHQILVDGGVCALLVPASLCGDLGAAPLRRLLWDSCQWHSLDGFINEDNSFAIHPHFKYVLICFQKGATTKAVDTKFGLRAGRDPLFGITSSGKRFNYTTELRAALGGQGQAILEMGGPDDACLLLALTKRHPRLSDFLAATCATFKREYDMTLDRHNLIQCKKSVAKDCLPLLEGSMIGQFQPLKKDSTFRFSIKQALLAHPEAVVRLGFVSTSSAFNTRSMIAACLPDWPAGNSLPVIEFARASVAQDPSIAIEAVEAALYTSAVFNSFVFDWMLRLKLSGNNLSFHLLQDLPFPTPCRDKEEALRVCVALCAMLTLGGEGGGVIASSTLFGQFKKLELHALYRQVISSLFSQSDNEPQYFGAEQLLRARIWLEAVVGFLFDLSAGDMSYILRDCSFDERTLMSRRRLIRSKIGERALPAPEQRSFFRVDKALKPQFRLTNMVEQTFAALKSSKHNFVADLFLYLEEQGQSPLLPPAIEEALTERFATLKATSIV